MLMSPQDVCYGTGSGQHFHSLEVFFFYSQQLADEDSNTLLTLGRRIIFPPSSEVCVRSFFCHYHFNRISTAQSSGWRRLPLVLELNLLLQRPQIQCNTISFRLSSWGLIWDPKTRCRLSLHNKRNHCDKNPVNCSEESPRLPNTSQRAAARPSAAMNKQIL